MTQQPNRLDFALIEVTLTLAVEIPFCEQHSGDADDYVIDTVLTRLSEEHTDGQIVVLGSDFTRLAVTK